MPFNIHTLVHDYLYSPTFDLIIDNLSNVVNSIFMTGFNDSAHVFHICGNHRVLDLRRESMFIHSSTFQSQTYKCCIPTPSNSTGVSNDGVVAFEESSRSEYIEVSFLLST